MSIISLFVLCSVILLVTSLLWQFLLCKEGTTMLKKYLNRICWAAVTRINAHTVVLVWRAYTSSPIIYYKGKSFSVIYNKLSREHRAVLYWAGISDDAINFLEKEINLLRQRPNDYGYAIYIPSDYEG